MTAENTSKQSVNIVESLLCDYRNLQSFGEYYDALDASQREILTQTWASIVTAYLDMLMPVVDLSCE